MRLRPVLNRIRRYTTASDGLALDVACAEAFRLIDAANEYIAASVPWTLAKEDRQPELDQALWTMAEATRLAAVLLAPVMPSSCEEILARLDAPVRHVAQLRLAADGQFIASGERRLQKGSYSRISQFCLAVR